MTLFKASDLYHKDNDNFFCPHCKDELCAKIIHDVKNDTITIHCGKCYQTIDISLPRICKKLIYLDQWFVSNITDDKKRDYCLRLLDKIEQLIHFQKVFVISSDTHARETAKIIIDEKQNTIWEKINSLSMGQIAGGDIQEKQYKRIFEEEDESFPWEDILTNNPHKWFVGKNISENIRAHLLLTNKWQVVLHKRNSYNDEDLNKEFRKILEKQLADIGTNCSINECHEYIKKVNHYDMLDAIDYYEKFTFLLEKYQPAYIINLLNHPGRHLYQVIANIINTCINNKKGYDAKKLINLLKNSNIEPKCDRISSAFEASRLFSAVQSERKGTGITKNPKKFSKKYGVSAINDTAHISLFSPYVDIMLVDNEARKKLTNTPIKEELSSTNCSFYSEDSIQQFEAYLDSLIDEQESNIVKSTRRLLIGMTPEEQTKKIVKKVTERFAQK